MSKPKLIERLTKKRPELTKTDSEDVIKVFSECIEKALIEGKSLELRGFGTFFLKRIKEKYSARNPKTGELIYVPKKKKIRFKASKKLKEILNK